MNSSREKTVWHLCSNRWNSAITEYALSSCSALRAQGYQNHFSALQDTIGEQRAQSYGFATTPFKSFGFGSAKKLISTYRQIRPNVIICYEGPETALTKCLLGSSARIIRFRGKPCEESTSNFMSRLAYSHVDRFLVPSHVLKENLNPHTQKPIDVVQLGCDDKVFHRMETLGGYLKKRPTIMMLARLDPIKGHQRLMRLMRILLDRWDDASRKPQLHIVGQTANLAEADIVGFAHAESLKMGEDVMISARRLTPISEYLSNSILGVVPSMGSEHICRVAEEFLLCGTPVAVSGVGALDEVLFPGAGASFKDKTDIEAAELIIKWCKESMSEGEIKKRQRSVAAKEYFSLKTMGEALGKII